MHRYWAKTVAPWDYDSDPQPGYENLPRIQQLLIREALGYLDRRYRDRTGVTIEVIRAECNNAPGDHANTRPTVARIMEFMFDTIEDVQVAELSDSGELWLEEWAPVVGVDFTARGQNLATHAGKGDLIRAVRAEAKGCHSGETPRLLLSYR